MGKTKESTRIHLSQEVQQEVATVYNLVGTEYCALQVAGWLSDCKLQTVRKLHTTCTQYKRAHFVVVFSPQVCPFYCVVCSLQLACSLH